MTKLADECCIKIIVPLIDIPFTDGSLTLICRRCSHLVNASEAAPAAALLLFWPLLVAVADEWISLLAGTGFPISVL